MQAGAARDATCGAQYASHPPPSDREKADRVDLEQSVLTRDATVAARRQTQAGGPRGIWHL